MMYISAKWAKKIHRDQMIDRVIAKSVLLLSVLGIVAGFVIVGVIIISATTSLCGQCL